MELYYVAKRWPCSDTVVHVAGPFGSHEDAWDVYCEHGSNTVEIVTQTIEIEVLT